MDIIEYNTRGNAAPREYNVIDANGASLVTIHQFHTNGLYYGRIWAPRVDGKQIRCRVSYTEHHETNTNETVQKFILPNPRTGGSFCFTLRYEPTPPSNRNMPLISLTGSEHTSDGAQIGHAQERTISIYRLRCGEYLGLQVGYVAIEVERDVPWRGSALYVGNDIYTVAGIE
jgi:hypothetical protein